MYQGVKRKQALLWSNLPAIITLTVCNNVIFGGGSSASFFWCAAHDDQTRRCKSVTGVCSNQPLAEGKGVRREGNLKEAGGKVPV
ncbi:MAG: hypothetical protein LBH90_08525 [Tannerella sp.]|nr:hypothetical protein [Tannerella sp.]